MGDKGARTKARMVESMLELIQANGYAGTGVNAVLEHAAAPKGSLYFHFPEGKESLGEQAVELAAERFDALVSEATTTASDAGAALGQVVDSLCAMLEQSGFELGCPVSVVTLEMGGASPRLRDACAGAFDRWIASVAAVLERGGAAPEAARALATTVVATIEGATILVRARRDVAPLRDAEGVLRMLLGTAA